MEERGREKQANELGEGERPGEDGEAIQKRFLRRKREEEGMVMGTSSTHTSDSQLWHQTSAVSMVLAVHGVLGAGRQAGALGMNASIWRPGDC